jgi:DNA repair exonuclease SbcCD nuclease subunit
LLFSDGDEVSQVTEFHSLTGLPFWPGEPSRKNFLAAAGHGLFAARERMKCKGTRGRRVRLAMLEENLCNSAMKLLHSADWQLGKCFKQFGDKASELRQVRFETLRRALQTARDRRVDAFVVAGDLFEDNEVDDSVVRSAVSVFAAFADVPVFILPGNHDPFIGPGSVWNRQSFLGVPNNVKVFRAAESVEINGGYLLASPLQQKNSTLDPSFKIVELATKLPAERIQVGVTHGALAIPSKHEPNDFPIALNAASRAKLDFLAAGHWHNWLLSDDGRLLMPGTPETDEFDQTDSGFVALVEVNERGKPPQIEKLPIATLSWQTLDFDFLDVDNARRHLQAEMAKLNDRSKTSVVRVRVRGSAARDVLADTRRWLDELLKPFLFAQLQDESSLAFSPAELDFLKANHPILSQVLADLDQMSALTIGTRNDSVSAEPLSPADKDRLLGEAHIEASELKATHFELARQLLLQKLQEAK